MVTLASKGGNVLVERPEGVSLVTWFTNGGDIYPGHFVTSIDMSDPDMNLPDAVTEIPYGVVIERKDGTAGSPDVAIADNTAIIVAPCGSGCVVWAQTITSRGALTPGLKLCTNGGGKIGAAFSFTDTLTSAMKKAITRIVGRSCEYDADVAATDYVQVRLCC